MAASISKTLTRNLLRRNSETTQALQLRFLATATSSPVPETQHSEKGGPSRWSNLLLFVTGVITFGLGTWQIIRRQDKIEMLKYRQNRLQMGPLDCNAVSPSSESVNSLEFCRVRCRGVFDEKKSIFIGPRSRSISGVTENGYYVITPLMPLANDAKSVQAPILVNRGWVPRNWREKSLEVAAADEQPSSIVPPFQESGKSSWWMFGSNKKKVAEDQVPTVKSTELIAVDGVRSPVYLFQQMILDPSSGSMLTFQPLLVLVDSPRTRSTLKPSMIMLTQAILIQFQRIRTSWFEVL